MINIVSLFMIKSIIEIYVTRDDDYKYVQNLELINVLNVYSKTSERKKNQLLWKKSIFISLTVLAALSEKS